MLDSFPPVTMRFQSRCRSIGRNLQISIKMQLRIIFPCLQRSESVIRRLQTRLLLRNGLSKILGFGEVRLQSLFHVLSAVRLQRSKVDVLVQSGKHVLGLIELRLMQAPVPARFRPIPGRNSATKQPKVAKYWTWT